MLLRALDCPRCGAPLPAESLGATVATCGYCAGTLAADPRVVWASSFDRALADAEGSLGPGVLEVGGRRYATEGSLALGENSEVWLGRWAHVGSTERVILKIPRGPAGSERLDTEWDVLRALHASAATGAEHFAGRLLPQPVVRGVTDHGTVSVFRFAHGFVHTLDDVRRVHGEALDPRHIVWIWGRLLELLGFVHASGFCHGAVLPEHVLVHARDHGVMLVGWSRSRAGACALDCVAASARMVRDLSGPMPAPLAALLDRAADEGGEAYALAHEFGGAARAAFGPKTFVPLHMPD